MPAAYTIDPSRSLVLSRGWGLLTDADLREHYRRLLADADFDPSFCQLIDLYDVDSYKVSTEMVREMAIMRVFRPGTRRAFVVDKELLDDMTRLMETYSELPKDGEVAVFRDLADAERWLCGGSNMIAGASSRPMSNPSSESTD